MAVALIAAANAWSATVSWDGGGGSLSWQNATNWDGNTLPGVGVKVVLYGPTNQSFNVMTTTNLGLPGPWQTTNTVFMTNTFRILPRESPTIPQRFFKVNTP